MAQHDGTILGKALPALSKLVQLPKSQHRKGYCAAGWGPAELQRAAVQSLKAGCESQLKIQPQSTCQNTIGKSSLRRKLGSISNLPDRPLFVASPFARILPSSGPKQTCLAIAYRGMRAPLGTAGHHSISPFDKLQTHLCNGAVPEVQLCDVTWTGDVWRCFPLSNNM